jgi:hypothetical protein
VQLSLPADPYRHHHRRRRCSHQLIPCTRSGALDFSLNLQPANPLRAADFFSQAASQACTTIIIIIVVVVIVNVIIRSPFT